MAEEAGAAEPAPAQPSEPVEPLVGADVGSLVTQAIGLSVGSMKEHQEGLRAGEDPDHVRKTRVALRRLRSNLRTFGEFLDRERTEPVVEELGALAAELGGVRDREVLAGRIRADAKALPEAEREPVGELTRVLEEEIRTARASTVAYLDSERFTKLFADLESLATDPPLTVAAGRPAAAVAGPLAAGPWEKLRKGIRSLPHDPPDAQLHRIRILAKRARYAAQAVEPAVGEPARAYAAAAAELQTILGEHQDAITTEAWLAAAARGDSAFVAGRLAGLERAKAIEMRGRWREAWKTLSARDLRAWMEPT